MAHKSRFLQIVWENLYNGAQTEKKMPPFWARHFMPESLRIYQDRLGTNMGIVGRKRERRRFFSAGEVYDARLEPDHGT